VVVRQWFDVNRRPSCESGPIGTVGRYAPIRAHARQNARADLLVSSIEVSLRDADDLLAFLQTLTDTSGLETVWEDCAGSP
jgi:hypothetical protein